MTLKNRRFKQYLGAVGAICGSLLIALPAIAQTQPQPRARVIPPTPEQQQPASVVMNPINGKANIRLVNETGAAIVYQAIGDTNQRTLQGQSSVTLRNLNTPMTITFYRPDRGLLRIYPQVTSQPGLLEVRFAATTDLGQDKTTLTIQPTGAVYLN